MVFTGDQDVEDFPASVNILDWWLFNNDIYSSDRTYQEVEQICQTNMHKLIDLRPYMIESPYVIYTTDPLAKASEMFKTLFLRALPVINPKDGNLVAVLSRHNIFQYSPL